MNQTCLWFHKCSRHGQVHAVHLIWGFQHCQFVRWSVKITRCACCNDLFLTWLWLLLTVSSPEPTFSVFYLCFNDTCFELVQKHFQCLIHPEVTLCWVLKSKNSLCSVLFIMHNQTKALKPTHVIAMMWLNGYDPFHLTPTSKQDLLPAWKSKLTACYSCLWECTNR